jgi:Adenylate and Guanylate cyclase catalytic domain
MAFSTDRRLSLPTVARKFRPLQLTILISGSIFRLIVSDTHPFVVCNVYRYSPSWQAYPIAPSASGSGNISLFNWNGAMDPFLGPGIEHAVATKQAVITEVVNMVSSKSPALYKESANATIEWASQLIAPDADPSEPLIRFLYPILDTVDTEAQSTTSTSNSTKAVGVASSSFYWTTLLSDMLPSTQYGLVVVISNACGQTFTYQVDGDKATYLGKGDLHVEEYDNMAISCNLTQLGEYYEGDAFYSGLPISDDYCLYNITMYPSESFEAIYRTGDPLMFTYSVVIIFAITAICFFGYDKLVSDRQRKVMKSAQKSAAIISSLFPSTVRDRLYAGAGDESFHAALIQPNKARLKNFLNDGADSSNVRKDGKIGTTGGSKPIADLFTDCTVMFADIANFTAWSSVREPSQVFTLLETIYGAFDQIAARRGVFKVEVSDRLSSPTVRSVWLNSSGGQCRKLILPCHSTFSRISPDDRRFVRRGNGSP